MIIDIHVETDACASAGELPLNQVLEASSLGLDGIVLVRRGALWTDEDISNVRLKTGDLRLQIFKGQIVKCKEGDILVIGCDSVFKDGFSSLELKHWARREGGCCVLILSNAGEFSKNIAYEYIDRKFSAFDLFDALEIFSDGISKKEMREFLELKRKVKFCALGGSASESPGRYMTKFFMPVRNEKELARAIINNKAYPCPGSGFCVDSRGGSLSSILWNTQKCEMAKCKGLVFDLYGTLIDLKSNETHNEFHRLAMWLSNENIQVSGHVLMNYYRQKCSELYANALKTVKFPEVDILQVFKDAITLFSGKPCSEEFARKAALVFRTLSIKSISLYPNARRILRELKRRGYSMGIISNAQAAFTIPEIEDLKLWQFFEFIILSSDVGCSKPDNKIYAIASRQLEFPPDKTAFIGDDLYGDIFGANQHGYKTVFVKTNVGNMTSPGKVSPDVTLCDGDLRNLLRIFP